MCLRRLYLVCKFSLDQILRDYFYAHEYCRQVCIFCSRFILFYFTHYVIPDSHIFKKIVHPLEAMKERCWMIGLHYLPYTRKRCVLPFGPLGVDCQAKEDHITNAGLKHTSKFSCTAALIELKVESRSHLH